MTPERNSESALSLNSRPPTIELLFNPPTFSRPWWLSKHSKPSEPIKSVADLPPSGSFFGNSQLSEPQSVMLWDPVPLLHSSTPFARHQSTSGQRATTQLSERQLYQRLLEAAATPISSGSESARQPTVKHADLQTTIVLDDESRYSSSKDSRLSLVGMVGHNAALALNHNRQGNEMDSSDTAIAWQKRCADTPYLSSAWLANLSSRFQSRAEQRKKEAECAEARAEFWGRQRILLEKSRMDNLEQRMSCLLRTPPVLDDPYLVPQPIPFELPYQPLKPHVPKVPELPVLTDAQLAEVEAAIRASSADTVLVDNFRLSVLRRDLMTLSSTNWLSDMVINFYMQLLYHRSQRQPTDGSNSWPRIAVLTTFFYAKLTAFSGGGHAGVRRWSRQLKLLDQDLILIPVHDRGMHWCLAAIDLRVKAITYYDSMGSGNDKCLRILMEYLKAESLDKKGVPLPDCESWQLINTEDTVPQQENGSDCGVFMCTFGEFLSRDALFSFSQMDMPNIRKRMMYEILTQQLLTTNTKLAPT